MPGLDASHPSHGGHQPCDGECYGGEGAHDRYSALNDVVLGLLHAGTYVIHLLQGAQHQMTKVSNMRPKSGRR